MQLSDSLIAAMIGACATFISAMFQLYVNAKRQAAEQKAGKPASKKTGTWLAIFALMLASTVGGYALAEYKNSVRSESDNAMRQEMQTRLHDIGEAAVRLEKVGMQKNELLDADARLAMERRRGAEGAIALISLPPCTGTPVSATATATATANAPPAPEAAACNESNALRAWVCAVIPAAATVTDVQLFTRQDDSAKPGAEAKVAAGQDAGGAKFIDGFSERVQPDAKEVCQRFLDWDSQKARQARILVKYTL